MTVVEQFSPTASGYLPGSNFDLTGGFDDADFLLDHDSPATAFSTHSKQLPWPFLTREEARAFHRYVHTLSAELDVCDSAAHFSRYLPLQAVRSPMITHAILAYAFKFEDVDASRLNEMALTHYTKCMQHLIPLLNDPSTELNDDVLATILLLRKYEEFEDEDTSTHLKAIARLNRLATGLSTFAQAGGLREAASWIALRQDCYIALTKQQRLTMDLDSFYGSEALARDTPEGLANRAVLIFAHVLNFAFASPGSFASRADMKNQWLELNKLADSWYKDRPAHAAPLWTIEADCDSKGVEGTLNGVLTFPELLMGHPAHVCSLQYYYLARLVLILWDPSVPRVGMFARDMQKACDREMFRYLRLVIGLAISNSQVTNGGFMACHLLLACEPYLAREKEQKAALRFLEDVRPRISWPPKKVMDRLRARWAGTGDTPVMHRGPA